MNHHTSCPAAISFDHGFGQSSEQRPQELRLITITTVTLIVMLTEIIAGKLTGSMALFGDGIHMGTHALALGLATAASVLSRRHANNRTFSFGMGKTGDLAGYTSAVILGLSALFVVAEALQRLIKSEPIAYGEALLVAGIGLAVNLISALLLSGIGPDHDHAAPVHDHHHDHHHHDNNLRAAFIHIVADAVTSVAAIIALFAAWNWGWNWLDPLVALAAAALIGTWAWGLIRDTGNVLLDREAPDSTRNRVIEALESDGDSQVIDLHLWAVGPGAFTLTAAIVTHHNRTPDEYRNLLPAHLGVYHPLIEVRQCQNCGK